MSEGGFNVGTAFHPPKRFQPMSLVSPVFGEVAPPRHHVARQLLFCLYIAPFWIEWMAKHPLEAKHAVKMGGDIQIKTKANVPNLQGAVGNPSFVCPC